MRATLPVLSTAPAMACAMTVAGSLRRTSVTPLVDAGPMPLSRRKRHIARLHHCGPPSAAHPPDRAGAPRRPDGPPTRR